MVIRFWQVPCNAIAWLSLQFKIQMGSLHPVVISDIFLFCFSPHWVKNVFYFFKEFVLVSSYTWLCLSCYKIPLLVCIILGFFLFFLLFHHKFLCMVSDPLERKSPHYLQMGSSAFDTRQLSDWFSAVVIHTQTPTAWHLHVYRPLLVALVSGQTPGSKNKLLLSILPICQHLWGIKREHRYRTKG